MNGMLYHPEHHRAVIDRRQREAQDLARSQSLARAARSARKQVAEHRRPMRLVALGSPMVALLALAAAVVLM